MSSVRRDPGGKPKEAHPRYLNREFSWLAFNRRVLAEAENPLNPPLERAKFLAIFESNLDEFFMVRVSGLIEQEEAGLGEMTPDGLTASEQLGPIAKIAGTYRSEAARIWEDGLKPELAQAGLAVVPVAEANDDEREKLADYFDSVVYPVCTPLMLHPATTFPFISNRSLNLAVTLQSDGEESVARVKVPDVLPRLVPLGQGRFALLEDLLAANLSALFPGVEVTGCYRFRVVRDADIEIRELEAADLITLIEQTLRLRRFGDPVLLETEAGTPAHVERILRTALELDPHDAWQTEGLVGLDALWELSTVDRPDLRFPPHTPFLHERLADSRSLFAEIARGDVLVHHPYDSFRSVEAFFASAADDPDVIGIKCTLYRVGSESPIVESLLRAAGRGKQVAAMIELKARFDESNNLVWSKALERAGAHVTYGFHDMKVHGKVCLVVRREGGGIRQYAHIGTGNYNPVTARLYTDLGLFTCEPDVCRDATELFNYLTGLSKQAQYRKLLVAPLNLREAVLERIDREAGHAREGRPSGIAIKVNSLVDPEVIDALYEASQAGTDIRLAVRGICCLRPGVEGMSERIEVVSVVGRFLEHSRVYYFENGGEPEAFLGSADIMRRNLDRRIEVLVPVTDPAQTAYLRDQVVMGCFRDNMGAWRLRPDGEYTPPERPATGQRAVQQELVAAPASALLPEVAPH